MPPTATQRPTAMPPKARTPSAAPPNPINPTEHPPKLMAPKATPPIDRKPMAMSPIAIQPTAGTSFSPRATGAHMQQGQAEEGPRAFVFIRLPDLRIPGGDLRIAERPLFRAQSVARSIEVQAEGQKHHHIADRQDGTEDDVRGGRAPPDRLLVDDAGKQNRHEDRDQRQHLTDLAADEPALTFTLGSLEARLHSEPRAEAADDRAQHRRRTPESQPVTPTPLFAAAVPIVAAVAEAVISGSAAITPSVKARPGVLCRSAPSTKSATCSCRSFRARARAAAWPRPRSAPVPRPRARPTGPRGRKG